MKQKKQLLAQFHKQNGNKQYCCFSGGFKVPQKTKYPIKQNQIKKTLTRQEIYKELGMSNAETKTYKLDNDYVPKTKLQLTDLLTEKIEHNLHKLRYYRQKMYSQQTNKYSTIQRYGNNRNQ